jgi:hypothetical protein
MYHRARCRYAAFQCNAQCQINEVWYCIGRDSEVRNAVLPVGKPASRLCCLPHATASSCEQRRTAGGVHASGGVHRSGTL